MRTAIACARGGGVAAGIAIAVVALAAPPAGAHSTAGLPSTDWRSQVVAVHAGGRTDARLRARITDLGQHLELTAAPSADVVVLGYSGEPYLWYTHDRVLENLRSPAVWLNRRKDARPTDKAPAPYRADAPPLWHAIATGSTYRWHDQRVHATSRDSRSHAWTVPLVVNGRAGAIAGRLDLVAGPPLLALLVAVVAAAAAVTLLALRRPRVLAAVALVVAVLATLQLVGTWEATTATLWQRIGPSSYALGAIAASVFVGVALSRHAGERAAEVLLLGGVVLAITGGLAHVDWLTHSQLPTTLDPALARAFLVAQLATGGGAAVAGVMLLEARVREAAGSTSEGASRRRAGDNPSETHSVEPAL